MRFNLSLEVWVDLNRWKVGIKENISERTKLDKNRRPKEQRVDEKCEFTENTHLSRFQFEGVSTRHPPPLSSISLLVCVCVFSHFSYVQLFATLCTVPHQVPLSMGFSRQEYWNALLCLSPGNPAGGFVTTWEASSLLLHKLNWGFHFYHSTRNTLSYSFFF